jgi:zinc transporter
MDGLIHLFDISPDGTAQHLADDALRSPLPESGYRWVHCDLTSDVQRWVEENLEPAAALALTAEETRPRCQHFKSGFVLILRGVNMNPGANPEDMVGIRLWVDDKRIISLRKRKLMAIADLAEGFNTGSGGPGSTGDFVSSLAFKLIERMEPVITDLSDQADALEDDAISETKDISRTANAALRREAILLRRYIAPQKEALNRLSTDPSPVISDQVRITIREASDRVTRFVEELDSVRERCAILHDQLADKRAEEMNRNMFILSIIAAIFLPLGFLTGLLGVNVGGIPGSDNPYAFTALCIIMVLISIGITLLFKKMKWL